ncbi:MAG: energy transducer TonB [Treponema sp.]|jgi:protein TonB|nr:energy transducer TonB [Treponema sp.]
MKSKAALPSIALGISLGIHAALFLFLSFTMTGGAVPGVQKETHPFSLFNVTLVENPVSNAASRPAPAQAISTVLPPQIETALAENYIPVDESPEPEDVQAAEQAKSLMTETGINGGAGGERGSGPSIADKQRSSAYVRKNFNYIQRRIRDRLVYPEEARKANIQGVTEAAFTLHPDGSVSGLAVLKSSGQQMLDDAALQAVRNAAPFQTGRQAELTIPVRISIPVAFRLR